MSEQQLLSLMGGLVLFSLFLGKYIIVPLSGFLFALGGYSQKLWRRLGIAMIALISSLLVDKLSFWRYCLVPFVYFGVLSLPYGENHKNWQRWITGFLFGFASITFLYPNIWLSLINGIVTGLGFQLVWYLSNKKGLTWKIAEWIIGVLIGLTLVFRPKKKEK